MAESWPPQLGAQLTAMTPGATLRRWMQVQYNPRSQPVNFVHAASDNQLYHHLLQQLDVFLLRSRKWEEALAAQVDATPSGDGKKAEAPRKNPYEARAIIDAVGNDQVRNCLALIRLLRISRGGLPKFPKEQTALKSADRLTYSRSAEELCEDQRLANHELGFLGGLHWDWLLAISRGSGKNAPKDVIASCEVLWPEALRAGQIAYRLSAQIKNLVYAKYAFGAALLPKLGQVWMHWLYPKNDEKKPVYKDFLADCDKTKKFRRVTLEVRESKIFGVTHAEVAGLAACAFEFFAPIEPAITFYQNPSALREIDAQLFQFSAVISSAVILASLDPKTSSLEKAPLTVTDRAILGLLKLPDSKLIGALSRG